GRHKVYAVEPHTVPSDDLEPPGGVDNRPGHSPIGPDYDGVHVANQGNQVRFLKRLGIDDVAFLLQQFRSFRMHCLIKKYFESRSHPSASSLFPLMFLSIIVAI